jgi:hypothetical protein
MKSEVVFALYRPHAGKDAELRRLIAQHLPVLRRLELVSEPRLGCPPRGG